MRKNVPVNLIIHFPHTEQEPTELARRTAAIHAETVLRHIQERIAPQSRRESCWRGLLGRPKTVFPVDKFQTNIYGFFPS